MPDIFPVYAFLSYLCARSAPDGSVLRIVFYCFAVLSGFAFGWLSRPECSLPHRRPNIRTVINHQILHKKPNDLL